MITVNWPIGIPPASVINRPGFFWISLDFLAQPVDVRLKRMGRLRLVFPYIGEQCIPRDNASIRTIQPLENTCFLFRQIDPPVVVVRQRFLRRLERVMADCENGIIGKTRADEAAPEFGPAEQIS